MLISGDGVAALIAAHLLLDRKCSVTCNAPVTSATTASPTVLLMDQTVDLIEQLTGVNCWTHGLRVDSRTLIWEKSNATSVPVKGLVMSMASLTNALREPVNDQIQWTNGSNPGVEDDADFILEAHGRGVASYQDCIPAATVHLGHRRAYCATVNWRSRPRKDVVIERTETGWGIVLPLNAEQAVIQFVTVTDPPIDQLSEFLQSQTSLTREISTSIKIDNIKQVFSIAAYPRIRCCLNSERSLALGESACSLDPLCGDGTGFAARSALLASAVCTYPDKRQRHLVQNYYVARIRKSFADHLEILRRYYCHFACNEGWCAEIAALHNYQLDQSLQNPNALHQFRLVNGQLMPHSNLGVG